MWLCTVRTEGVRWARVRVQVDLDLNLIIVWVLIGLMETERKCGKVRGSVSAAAYTGGVITKWSSTYRRRGLRESRYQTPVLASDRRRRQRLWLAAGFRVPGLCCRWCSSLESYCPFSLFALRFWCSNLLLSVLLRLVIFHLFSQKKKKFLLFLVYLSFFFLIWLSDFIHLFSKCD